MKKQVVICQQEFEPEKNNRSKITLQGEHLEFKKKCAQFMQSRDIEFVGSYKK